MRDSYSVSNLIFLKMQGDCKCKELHFSHSLKKATFHQNNIVFRPLYLLTINTDIQGAHFRPAWFSLCYKDHRYHQFSVKTDRRGKKGEAHF